MPKASPEVQKRGKFLVPENALQNPIFLGIGGGVCFGSWLKDSKVHQFLRLTCNYFLLQDLFFSNEYTIFKIFLLSWCTHQSLVTGVQHLPWLCSLPHEAKFANELQVWRRNFEKIAPFWSTVWHPPPKFYSGRGWPLNIHFRVQKICLPIQNTYFVFGNFKFSFCTFSNSNKLGMVKAENVKLWHH